MEQIIPFSSKNDASEFRDINYNFFLTGRIVPERTSARIDNITKKFQTRDVKGIYNIHIHESHVMLQAKIPNETNINTAINSFKFIIINKITQISFNICSYYHFITDSIFFNGNAYLASVDEPIFEEEKSDYTFIKYSEHENQQIEIESFKISRAMHLATLAINHPYDTPVFCRMAIEFIARCISGQLDEGKNINFEPMQNNLKLKKETIKSFKDKAAIIRHGRVVEISWNERKYILELTWEIVNRFKIYEIDNEKNIEFIEI